MWGIPPEREFCYNVLMSDGGPLAFQIRPFRSTDQAACKRLYHEGLLGGKIADNDTGTDIDDIQHVYMRRAGSHFWVACDLTNDALVLGMVGVQQHEPGVGEIRRLRVDLNHRGIRIGSQLMEQAVKFCSEHSYLKVALDTFIEIKPAIELFQKFHFHHSRTRNVGGKDLLYFYFDLYEGEKRPASK